MPSAGLERCRHREAERFERFAQRVIGTERIDRVLVSVLCGPKVGVEGKHPLRDWHRGTGTSVETERVIRPIDTERGVNYRKHDLQFDAGRHTRNPVSTGNGLQELRESNLLSARALESRIQGGTAKN